MILHGNLNQQSIDYPDKRGWFLGHFMEPDSPLQNESVELKWGRHQSGEAKEVSALNTVAKSVAILVKGKFVFEFESDKQAVDLGTEGDYVFYDAQVPHRWKCLEDGILVTVRWPSIAGDQIFK